MCGAMSSDGLSIDAVARTFGDVTTSFAPNELAYLALTSKVELPLRDRLAWSLHTSLWPEYVVAREWRRTDLAVLHRDSPAAPVMLLEAKAMYSFDGCTERGCAQYEAYVRSDQAKASALAGCNTSVFLLLLATHPEGAPDPSVRDIIKYSSGITRAKRHFPEPDEVREVCLDRMTPIMEALGRTVRGSLHAGRSFNLEVTIDYWLVQP